MLSLSEGSALFFSFLFGGLAVSKSDSRIEGGRAAAAVVAVAAAVAVVVACSLVQECNWRSSSVIRAIKLELVHVE